MSNISANPLPARTNPQAAPAASVRSILMLGSCPGVGTTTAARLVCSAATGGTPRRRAARITDRLGAPAGDSETLDFSPFADLTSSFLSLAQRLSEGGAVIDCSAGAVDRMFGEASRANVGHLLAKGEGGGSVAAVVVGPSPSSATRAGEHLRWLADHGATLGVVGISAILVDPFGAPSAWKARAHTKLQAQATEMKAGIGSIPAYDLYLAERIGFEFMCDATEEDLAAKLNVGAIEAAMRRSHFKAWLNAATEGLRNAGVLPAKAAAKAA